MTSPAQGLQYVHSRAPGSSLRFGRWMGVKLHALVVMVVALSLLRSDPSLTLILGGVLVASLFATLGFLEARRTALWLNPLSFYLLWNSVGCGISAVHMGLKVRTGECVSFSIASIPPPDLAAGYVITLLGSLAVHAGLRSMRPSATPGGVHPRKILAEASPFAFAWILLILWFVGLVYQWHSSWFSAIGAPAKLLMWASTTAVVIFGIVPPVFFGIKRLTWAVLFAAGTLGVIAVNLRSGSKAYIMFSFLPLVWTMLVHRRGRRWLPVLLAGLAFIYFVVVAPAISKVRLHRQDPALAGSSVFTESVDPALFGSPTLLLSSISVQAQRFLERQFDAFPVGFIRGEVRKDGLKNGETMAYATYAFVPRLFWPEKPIVGRGAWFTAYLGFSARETESTTSTGLTATGEWYWNFGVIGVCLGMFGVGWLYGVLWRMAGDLPVGRPMHMLLYVMITVGGMTDMPEAITVYAAAVSELLVFAVVFGFLDLRRRGWEDNVAFASR